MKYNLSILKNAEVGFVLPIKGEQHIISGTITNIQQKKDVITFVFTETMLDIKTNWFEHCKVLSNDNLMLFVPDPDILTPFLGFTMFDTYGFPIELTQEIVNEHGYNLDTEGFEILRQLQKSQSKGTFKTKENVF